MNTRSFITSLLATLLMPWKAITRTVRPVYKPLLVQVYPKDWEELPELFVHSKSSNQVYPYKIVREWDDENDRWEGQKLFNPWRNKWWGKDVNGKDTLLCLDRMRGADNFWKFDPDLLFFRKL